MISRWFLQVRILSLGRAPRGAASGHARAGPGSTGEGTATRAARSDQREPRRRPAPVVPSFPPGAFHAPQFDLLLRPGVRFSPRLRRLRCARESRERWIQVKRTFQPSNLKRKRRHGISCAHGDEGGTQDHQEPARQEAEQAERLSSASLPATLPARLAGEPRRDGEREPRACRLTRARDFKRVFAGPLTSVGEGLRVLARRNRQGGARLGMAIPRRWPSAPAKSSPASRHDASPCRTRHETAGSDGPPPVGPSAGVPARPRSDAP